MQIVVGHCPRAGEILTEVCCGCHTFTGHVHRDEGRIAVSVDAFEFLFQDGSDELDKMLFTKRHLRVCVNTSPTLALLVDHDVLEFPTVLTALIITGGQAQTIPDELGRNRVQLLLDLV